ncbi:hypothetical protein TI39_contig360g00010 [Zymoseptoria brevis]|uniref:HNH nuclease domain-containing protein n=1 Tax=Zymoseptoria brevis TaxID=1047168 RepID=A0A0F4GQQ5_9PEZI|nr:hypothetical protein TI39_contig360g00010 [Zymoseptoria brevis]
MYREGSISKEDLIRLISASEAKRNLLLREKGALLGKRRKISDVFFEAIQDRKVGIDQAYCDAVSFVLGPVYNATLNVRGQRSKGQQDQWRHAVRTYLDARCKGKGKEDWVWCSITRGYHRGGQQEKDSSMKTAHIIPRKLPGKLVKALMGRQHELEDGQDIIWDAKNGIPMFKEIEVAFDLARIVIVPATEHNDGRFKVMVLDKSLFEDANNQIDTSFGAHTTWKEIHEQELVFKHPINRPARRNLFFHFVTSLLRRELYEAPDWFKDVDEVADFNNMWASPGAYLRRSTLRHLLNRIGKTATNGPLQKNAEQWLKACFDEKAPTPPDDEDPSTSEQRIADEIFENQIISPARSRTESEEDQDEE